MMSMEETNRKVPISPEIQELIVRLMSWKMGITWDDLRFLYRAGYASGGLAALRDLKNELSK